MGNESMTPGYFESIHEDLSAMECAWWADLGRLQLVQMDLNMLKSFCFCLEIWNYSVDEESMERWRTVITPFKVIWPKDFTEISLLLQRCATGPEDTSIQDFNSVMCLLEGNVLQSKQHFQGWYRNLIMHCKFSKVGKMLKFIREIQRNLESFTVSRAGKIVPLKKQSDVLTAKMVFLERKLTKVRHCPDGKEILQFMNFVGNFASSVVCLTCLYWAKEDDPEFACEMEIFLFDMLQKFIPHAFDVTPILLKSDDLQPVSDSFLLAEAVESFVDFFFGHLAIVLKDDFLILQDSLMFLITFLMDPRCENAGGDLIGSQIYAILHHDMYLLLSFDEMNKDFSDKKALLSGCMTRIDIANGKIRQLNCGSSGSWITLEVEEMEYKYFVSLHRELSSIEKDSKGAVMEQIQLYKMGLTFLRAFLRWLATGDDTDEETKAKLSSMIISIRGIWDVREDRERLLAHRLHAIREGSITEDWHPLAFELQGKIQQSKLETGAWCINFFQSSFQFKASTSNKVLEFLDSILENLNGLVSSENIVLFKKQTETFEDKLIFLKNLLNLAVNCANYEDLEEFSMFVQAFANDAYCLTFLYWVKDANAESVYETNCILTHMLRKIKPATPDVSRLYFGTLMAVCEQRSDCNLFVQTAFSFVELFLEDLVTHLKDDEFQVLQDNIIFLLIFLNDPPNQNAEELICSQIDVVFWEVLYNLTPFDDIEAKKKVTLSDFMVKIEAINANIRRTYGKFPDSSLYNFPKVISPLFLDFLLQNLRNLKDRMNSDPKYVPFAKYKFIKIEEELVSLYPLFNRIFDLQSELKETWLEVANVLHLTEYVIMSCVSSLFVSDHPFWYHMAYLSNVIDEIKVVKAKLEMIKLELPSSVGYISGLKDQGRPLEINEIVVGFEDEKEKIIDMLTLGSKSLDIVSIVGMGGLGKTTLAKKVFSSSFVKQHFDVFAFCSVSLDHNTRRLLLDIIRDIKGDDDLGRGMTNDDLAHKLWKCLSRQKYLIVLDDIWKVSAWNEVKRSFPDDDNGSRVMFTTRSLDVAKKCGINCSPHQLRFLYEVESLEILQKKVFGNDISPSYLNKVEKQIAKSCKGLPLAVVVIGGLLARTEKSLSWWTEVAQRLTYYLSDEGCMEILELSYKHLPRNLKPCLIYLGAFPEDSLISVNHVIRLWIAEGFIQESQTKSLEDVAEEYFYDLVDRSFVIVVERSSGGGIKTFRIHDLIHELCQTKCRDGNFFQLNHGSASSEPSIHNHYRVSTQNNAAGSSLSDARTLHIFGDYGLEEVSEFPLKKFKLLHVLDISTLRWKGNDVNELTSLIHLRYIDAILRKIPNSIPSLLSNLWNITYLRLRLEAEMHLSDTFWRLKSLRHVKVESCILKFPDDENLSSDQILDKVVSFSRPVLSTGKDVKTLLQRLPAVRKLTCLIKEPTEPLDFDRELESLKLLQWDNSYQPNDSHQSDDSDSDQPDDSDQTDNSDQLEDSGQEDDSDIPNDSGQLDDSDQPEDSGQEADSDIPNDSDQLDDSEQPDDSDQLNDSTQQSNSDLADDSDQANNADQPQDSGQEDDSDIPNDSEQPDDSDQPDDSNLSNDSDQSHEQRHYIINFPSTLQKLTLVSFPLPLKTLLAIAELQSLQVLKLRYGFFEKSRLETEDLVFQNLKFFQLIDSYLEQWNASTDSFPCLEQVEIKCSELKELPPCFGEMSTLKRIVIDGSSHEANNSALRIQEELMELGIPLEVSILNTW